MANTLTFTNDNQGHWESSCTSSGERMAVQINRAASGPLIVYGSIDGLDRIILKDFGPRANKDIIFEIDVPADMIITLVSYPKVTAAKTVGA